MFKRTAISTAVTLALAVPVVALALEAGGLEITGYLKNETSVFTNSGQTTSSISSKLDTSDSHDAGDLLKFENSLRLFINGDIGDDASWHADVNFIYDTEGVDGTGGDDRWDFQSHERFTQHDWLRELYVDAFFGGWDFRLGKQQVVWGTADGIKLLDIINPTDFRELNQNTFEDSRIPIWMLKAETDVTDTGNVQFIVAQHEENKIPGLSEDGDTGQPFIMKGVETITGEVNGFLNVAPALAKVATSFNTAATLGMINGVPSPLGLVPTSGLTVDGFAGVPVDVGTAPGAILLPGHPLYNPDNTAPGFIPLNGIAQFGLATTPGADPNGNMWVTNLMNINGPQPQDVTWNPGVARSGFEYMPNATFATFNTFDGIDSKYRRDYPGEENVNAGFRWKQNLDNGLNYSLNYFYHYSANPDINLSWNDSVTGERLTVQRAPAGDFIDNSTGAPGPDGMPDLADFSQSLGPNEVPSDVSTNPFDTTTILLHNSAGQYYGTFDPTGGFGAHTTNDPELRFNEELHRVHSLGASFDYGVDNFPVPVVVRGEFLYDKDDKQPVVDKRLLGIGDLSNALVMEDADYFKYVLGVDVTVLTNLLVSGQFIQFINLDYEDSSRRCTTQTGTSYDCSKYTADFATLNMSNGLNQGYEFKEFVSLFFSKPFGEAQRGRWNNITIWEDGGGWWNRFDVEYSFTDSLVGTVEWNNYWGDEDTTFGQFDKSSNFQLGIKYIIE
ncbi:MAG: RNA polymerase-associated protein rapA [Pseudomonadota bacterium]